MKKKPDETITVAEAARRLKVNPQTVRRAVINGKLRGVYGGLMQNRIKGVSAESVEAILKSANGGKR